MQREYTEQLIAHIFAPLQLTAWSATLNFLQLQVKKKKNFNKKLQIVEQWKILLLAHSDEK